MSFPKRRFETKKTLGAMTVLYMAPTVIKGMQDGDGSLSDSARGFTTENDDLDSPNIFVA